MIISRQPLAMMRVRVFPTPEALARALALDVARRLAEQPNLVLGLPTGRTPIPARNPSIWAGVSRPAWLSLWPASGRPKPLIV